MTWICTLSLIHISALVPTTPTAFQNELKTFRDSLISSCKKKNILITDTSA